MFFHSFSFANTLLGSSQDRFSFLRITHTRIRQILFEVVLLILDYFLVWLIQLFEVASFTNGMVPAAEANKEEELDLFLTAVTRSTEGQI